MYGNKFPSKQRDLCIGIYVVKHFSKYIVVVSIETNKLCADKNKRQCLKQIIMK